MGLLSTAGNALDWEETKKNRSLVKKNGITEFLKTYNRFKDEKKYPFKWGDEIEFSIIRFDHTKKLAQLSLKAESLLDKLNNAADTTPNVTYHPEYASYMIEATPKYPFDADLNGFKYLEENMSLRRKLVEENLDEDEFILAITNFPQIGCSNFTYPEFAPTPEKGITRSLFFPDEAIFKAHPRFRTLSGNIHKRRGQKVSIHVPIFDDLNTSRPFRESFDFDGGDETRENEVYMDATGFGMGCCCLQTTFQVEFYRQCMIWQRFGKITYFSLI